MADDDDDDLAEASTSMATTPMPLIALNDTKAGMTGLDTERINAVIQEASVGSKFYEEKLRSQERISRQADRMRQSMVRLTEAEVQRATRSMDATAEELRAGRDLSRTILHVDMDAFYAAVETKDDPGLADKPMAVGGLGMISTSNYVARKFGVRAGMPGFIGKKLCPDLVLVRPNFDKYRRESEIVRGVFREYDPNFSAMSLDEAYLDITEYLRSCFPERTAEDVVAEIRSKIKEKTGGLTASAGIATNTFLAKVCSDQNKPDGQFSLGRTEEEIMAFVEALPIRKVSGIGNVTEQLLKVLGVHNCRDLFEKRGYLKLLFSEISCSSFLRISLGIGSTRLSDWTERDRKSLSNETTFRDASNPEQLFDICKGLCKDLATEMDKEGIQGRAVTLKIKTHRFRTKSKVTNLLEHTSSAEVVEATARALLRCFMEAAEEKPLKLRLMGVRMSDFRDDAAGAADESCGSRQTRMDAFLGKQEDEKTRRSKSVFSCPICLRDVPASSEAAFNSHLDSCLESTEGDKVVLGVSETKAPNCLREVLSPSEKSSVDYNIESYLEGEMDDAVASTSSLGLRCPICDLALNDSSEEVANRHVNNCLEQQTDVVVVAKGEKRRVGMMEEEEVERKKNLAKKSRGNIKSYFRVI